MIGDIPSWLGKRPCLRTFDRRTVRGNSEKDVWLLALRNCTSDEGRPFEFGSQVLISSHRKLLSSKATVVNVAEKSGHDLDRRD
jgi:hypothetical protein